MSALSEAPGGGSGGAAVPGSELGSMEQAPIADAVTTRIAAAMHLVTVRIGTSTSYPPGQPPAPIRAAGVGTDGFLSASRSRGRTARHAAPAVTPS